MEMQEPGGLDAEVAVHYIPNTMNVTQEARPQKPCPVDSTPEETVGSSAKWCPAVPGTFGSTVGLVCKLVRLCTQAGTVLCT